MAIFISDQNQIGFFYESGTYGTKSGTLQWIGQVQESEITVNPNVIATRFLGTNSRNVQQFNNGPLDIEGTFTYFPQDWRFLLFSLGSCVEVGSPSPYTHAISEINNDDANLMTSGLDNPFISFGLEESWKSSVGSENFIQTVQGAMVDTMEITMAQGEPVSVEVSWIGRNVIAGSQQPSGVTIGALRPFLWSDVQVHIPSGTIYNEVTEAAMTINNNLENRHYLNGSRVAFRPFPLNRDYEISLTLDASHTRTKTLWETYFDLGSANLGSGPDPFNMMISVVDAGAGAGSRDAFFVFSGCRITEMSNPTPLEGINEHELTIMAGSMTGSVADLIHLYNAWKTQA